MKEYDFHPAADEFPMMSSHRYAELVEDIKKHGQREPITLCDGKVLDGRNRYKACVELGVEPKTRVYDGNPWDLAWSLNGTRRDLVDEQRYLIWKVCNEHGEAWQAERQRIADEANRKRSETQIGVPKAVAKERARTECPNTLPEPRMPTIAPQPKPEPVRTEENVREHSVPARSENRPSEHPDRAARAAAARVNKGAVARGDKLAKVRPDLAEKVRKGIVKPAEAHREMQREELKAKLDEVAAREVEAPSGKFDVIVIDPPWPMEKIERDCRPNQSEFDYPTMSEDELSALSIPTEDDCHVWLWTTHRFLPMAMRLLDAWSLKYVCTFVWHKPGGFQPIGLPQYNCEFAIYARRGSPKFLDTKAFNTCFDAPRGKHSEKPEEFYETLRRVTGGRRLDMFNRRTIDGFSAWGKESSGE